MAKPIRATVKRRDVLAHIILMIRLAWAGETPIDCYAVHRLRIAEINAVGIDQFTRLVDWATQADGKLADARTKRPARRRATRRRDRTRHTKEGCAIRQTTRTPTECNSDKICRVAPATARSGD